MAISANFTINGVANPARHTTTYGATVNLALVNPAGIDTIEWEVETSSDSGDTLPTITPGGTPTGATASFTMVADPSDGRGRTMQVKCTVRTQYETAVSRGVVGVLNDAGYMPVCINEGKVRDAVSGWLDELNSALGAVVPDGSITSAKLAEGIVFTNTTADGGNPALTVAPATAAQFASLANAGARTYDYDPGANGYYTLVYEFRLVVGGAYRKVAASQDFKRVAGTCSLEGAAVISGLGVQTGVAVAFSIASDDVRVTLTNTTGGALTGHYWRSVLSGDLPT